MEKIIFAGAYGIHSQGDDAALIAMVEGVRKRLGVFDGVVISRHAKNNPYGLYGLRTIQNIEYDHKSESIGKWFRGFNYGDDRTSLQQIQDEIASSDLLVIGAGNALIDITIDLLRGPIPYFFILTMMAKMVETRVMWFGLSVGPFLTAYGRNLSRISATLADVITVRDNQSCIELQQLGYKGPIIKLPDPVLSLHPSSPESVFTPASLPVTYSENSNIIAISVCKVSSDGILDTGQYVKRMASVCDELILRYNATLMFIPQCTYTNGELNEDDRNIANMVVGSMRNNDNVIKIDEDLTVEQCLSLYGKAKIAICTRLHANVYAAIQGVPTVAISYNPKVAGFMHWLGCDKMIVSLHDLSTRVVLDKVELALTEYDKLSSKISSRVEAGRIEVERYFDIASQLIKTK